ncbi:hypothetical protein [Zavarzinella formosa]|uniref:hypothetical protein n=1 Tax=Zavarzinella formosa TaxID=360055 RepID=UPI0012F9634F|nr:hypothetical protein [Zavarzinella formosa]
MRSCRSGRMRVLLMAVFAGFAFSGCGKEGPPTAEVSGVVMLDGVPVPEGSITFTPVEGTLGATAGGVIKNGKYQISADKGPGIGKNKVSINYPKETGKRVPDASSPGKDRTEVTEAIPAKYNSASTLVHPITTGKNTLDFDLKSK